MSGICALYRFNNNFLEQNELSRMTQTMSSIGLDGSHLWQSTCVGFGHQAFNLTEESITEILPYYDPVSKIAITADCRLDNRGELCEHFSCKDELCVSDSFLILCAYQKWGKDCPRYLLGEFAVAIWDSNEQELICFTDHTGQRTFYYYHDANLFALATEMKALHALSGVHRKPDLERIAAQDSAGYRLDRPEMTCYENIFRSPASTLFSIKRKQIQHHTYWTPDINQRIHFSSEDDFIETFQNLFDTIMRAKLRSHHSVVSLHSGGLDSSSITAMAAHILAQDKKKLTALSAVLPPGYHGKIIDESHFIRLLQKPNLKIQYVTDEWRGPFDGLSDIRSTLSEPENQSSRYFLYKAFATSASQQGARIILDGCYGEKGPSFHGRGYYAELLLNMHWRTLLHESRMHVKLYNKTWLRFALKEWLFPLVPAAVQTKMERGSDTRFAQNATFINPSFINSHILDVASKKAWARLNVQYPNHRQHQYQAMRYLRGSNPYVYDDNKRPVYFSYPYNDKRMLELCLAMPGNLKVRNGYKRYAIRSGMRGLMPDELRFRTTKAPFSPDFHERYNRQLIKAQAFVADVPKTPLIKEIINTSKLELELKRQIQEHAPTKSDLMIMNRLSSAVYLMAFLATFD